MRTLSSLSSLLLFCLVAVMIFPTPISGSALENPSVAALPKQDSTVTPVWPPLQISQVSVSSEPLVGSVVNLSIGIMSVDNETEVALTIDFFENYDNPVHFISGVRSWQGTLTANQPMTFTLSIMVEREGEWPVEIRVMQLTGASQYQAIETIHLQSSQVQGKMIRGLEYQPTLPVVQGHTLHITDTFSSPSSTFSPGIGEIQVTGTIRYSARRDQGSSPFERPLGRIGMQLWTVTPGYHLLLRTTQTNDNGEYAFDPITNGPSLDLYIVIYATDNQRVKVTDWNGTIHSHSRQLDPNHSPDTYPDGVVPFDYTIPLNPIQTEISSQPFYIYDLTANVALGWLQQQTGWTPSSFLEIHWPYGCAWIGGLPCYAGQIFLPFDDGIKPDRILHEYGHFILAKAINDENKVINACIKLDGTWWNHDLWMETDADCAWSEGWAHFFEAAVQAHNEVEFTNMDPVEQVNIELLVLQRTTKAWLPPACSTSSTAPAKPMTNFLTASTAPPTTASGITAPRPTTAASPSPSKPFGMPSKRAAPLMPATARPSYSTTS